MNYAGLIPNDYTNGEGICVSYWTQGCPHRCPECHNPQTWDLSKGKEVPSNIKNQIITAIGANGIQRNFSILGGEPLCKENISFVAQLVASVRIVYPNIKIFIWTGYTLEELKDNIEIEEPLNIILKNINVLIDGRYERSLRDVTLPLRGSSNQRILEKNKDF